MAIARVGAGAGAGTETSGAALNLVCPAAVSANHILIAHVMHTGITTNPTTPSGWTLLYPNPADITVGAPIGTGTATARHWAFGKLAVGTEDGTTVSFGTGGGTNGRAGRIYSFSGYVSGTITDVVPAASFTDIPTETDPSGPEVTTSIAGALAIALMCQDDNNTHTGLTGETGGTWGDYLEFVDANLGPQGLALAFNSCTPDTDPGTVTGGTLAGTNDESGTIGFEIRPSVPVVAPQDNTGTDTTTITETGVGLAVATATDSFAVSESAFAEAVLALLASENISVVEEAASEQVFAFSATDSFSISDTGAAEEVLGLTATETLTLTEEATQAEGPTGPPLYVYGMARVRQYIEAGSITVSEWTLENVRTDIGPLIGSTGVSVTVYTGHTTAAPSSTYALVPNSTTLGNYRALVREPGTPEQRGFAVFTISTPSTGTWRIACPVH